MIEAADESFDLTRSDFIFGEVERHGPTQGGLGAREPLRRGVPVAFEELQGLAEQPRGAKESVRLIREEAPVTLATRHRPTGDVDEASDALE